MPKKTKGTPASPSGKYVRVELAQDLSVEYRPIAKRPRLRVRYPRVKSPPPLPASAQPARPAKPPSPAPSIASRSDHPESAKLRRAKEHLQKLLLKPRTATGRKSTLHGFENIVGVGVGIKRGDGHRPGVGEACVIVYVARKIRDRKTISRRARVPKMVLGVPTDVVGIGPLRACQADGRPPAYAGYSIGNARSNITGTLGCLVRRDNNLYILSNNHVLALGGAAQPDDPILQPSRHDGGQYPGDVIATLSEQVDLNFNGPFNEVDCAIAQTNSDLVEGYISQIGWIGLPPVSAAVHLLVQKFGRTTGRTLGIVSDVQASVKVMYDDVNPGWYALFADLIAINPLDDKPFADDGDSGSLVVTHDGNRPVGLLVAAYNGVGFACPIDRVLQAMNVQIVVSVNDPF